MFGHLIDMRSVDEMLANEKSSRINEPELSQPLCTALQVAIVDLLAYWNVRPSVVVGHSSGEIGVSIIFRPWLNEKLNSLGGLC